MKECKATFQKIKNYLLADLSLAHFDPKKGIGAVILHKFKDRTTKPIAHASRTLLPAERNYSQIEKEILDIIYAIKKFCRFKHGRKLTLQMDHRPLLTIFGSKKGISTHNTNRLQCRRIILLNYNFKMEFIEKTKTCWWFVMTDPKIFRGIRRNTESCLKGWKGIIHIVIQYNSGVTCDSRRYKKKQLRKTNSLKKWRNRYSQLKDRKKDQVYHLNQSASKYYYMQIELYTAKENPERISYRSKMCSYTYWLRMNQDIEKNGKRV